MSWFLTSGQVLAGVILIALGVLWTWLFSNRSAVTAAVLTIIPIVALLLLVVGTVLILSGAGLM